MFIDSSIGLLELYLKKIPLECMWHFPQEFMINTWWELQGGGVPVTHALDCEVVVSEFEI